MHYIFVHTANVYRFFAILGGYSCCSCGYNSVGLSYLRRQPKRVVRNAWNNSGSPNCRNFCNYFWQNNASDRLQYWRHWDYGLRGAEQQTPDRWRAFFGHPYCVPWGCNGRGGFHILNHWGNPQQKAGAYIKRIV